MKERLARTERSLNRTMDPIIEPRGTRGNLATQHITTAMDKHSQAIKPRTPGQQCLPCHDKIRVDKILTSSSIKPSESNMEEGD